MCVVCVTWGTSGFHGGTESLTIRTPGWSRGRGTRRVGGGLRRAHRSRSFKEPPCGAGEECPHLSAPNAEADVRPGCLIKPDVKEFCEQYKTMTHCSLNSLKINFI